MDTEFAQLKTSIADASRKVMKELYDRDWVTNDVEELRKQINRR